MHDDAGCAIGVAFIFAIIAIISMRSCIGAERRVSCHENLQRHAFTAADTLGFVKTGCQLSIIGETK